MNRTTIITSTLLAATAGTGCASADAAPATIKGKTATFAAREEVTIKVPDGAQRLRVWVALPQKDPAQTVANLAIEAPVAHRTENDSEGNQVLYLEEARPKAGDWKVAMGFDLTRAEVRSGVSPERATPITDADRAQHARYLTPSQHVVIDDRIKKLSAEIVGAETNPVRAARRIYDWVLQHSDYWVKDPKNKKASPVGSTLYCLDQCTGNCTDFHSLWTSLARAAGIPTRLVYGSFFKAELDGKDTDQSYHCWPEFYAPGIGWVPHDVAVADIFVGDFQVTAENATLVNRTTADGYHGAEPAKVDYYFGNLDERRVVWSSGRDLVLSPRQDGGPVNAMPKAYVEIDGKPVPEGATGWVRKLTYKQKP